jgi:hypothetical protein
MEKIKLLSGNPLAHRDEPGGLFIGASMSLFALMNSAPAELLHPLNDAALQSHWLHRRRQDARL